MFALRCVLAVLLTIFLILLPLPNEAASKPLGILTQANAAYLNTAVAYVGLAVFDGEGLSTMADGQASVRIGGSSVTLAAKTSATLEQSGQGAHVDLDSGALFFSSAESNPVEVHVEGAFVRAHDSSGARADVLIFAPKIVQITAKQGSLDFWYHDEFRVLPAGDTYRIFLESEAEPQPQGPAGAGAGKDPGAQKAGMALGRKVTFFILGTAGAGLAAWGIHDWVNSNSGMESPARP
jgi:ferric-dicitrate binding protein FerR (iron transport regulator)